MTETISRGIERGIGRRPDVLIIGAGVMGLTTGIVLAESLGLTPVIWAKDLPPNTTSDTAGAFLFPAMHGRNNSVPEWTASTARRLKSEAQKEGSGVIPMKTRSVSRTDLKTPDLESALGTPTKLTPKTLPEGFKSGFQIQGAVMDTSLYMKHLVNEFVRLGGVIEQREIKDINEAFSESDIVINCTGLGSKDLFQDQELFPARGQVLRVKKDRGLRINREGEEHVILNDAMHAVVVPRTNDYVLGTTSQVGDYNTEPTKEDTEEILSKVEDLIVSFGNLDDFEEVVGLRPGRLDIRFELQQVGNKRKILIHNYGHGGAGFTLSWGCAQEIAGWVGDVLREREKTKVSPRPGRERSPDLP